MTQTVVYIPVDEIKGAQYFILCKSDLSPINQLLEKKENVYVFTPEQLFERDKRIAGDAFTTGQAYEYEKHFGAVPRVMENKTEYLNNLKP